jgi:DNA-binding beta-propeller fold protein YncE
VRALRCIGLTVAVFLSLSSVAAGADRIYWTNATASAVKFGNTDASGGAATLFGSEADPLHGIAIDPVLGKVLWANEGSDAIRSGAIDGTGSPASLFTGESDPIGLAVDSASGRVYWADFASGAIRVAGADGSPAPANLFTGEDQPRGVAVAPAHGKIYWTTQGTGSVRVGNLDGSGTAATLFPGDPDLNLPTGVAVDEAAGKIYWADDLTGSIAVGNLDGSGTPSVLYSGEAGPVGLALDPAAGRLYWAADGGGIRVGSLNGSVPAGDLYPDELGAQYVALLSAPRGTGRPSLSGGTQVGQALNCTTGNWADDDAGAFLFRQPSSHVYSWQRNGVDVAGAVSSSFAPTLSGSYTCTVTAANPAGSAAQTSDAVAISAPPPSCSNVSPSTTEGAAVQVSLQCSGEGPLTFEVTAQPEHGALSGLDPATGIVTYTPNPGFSGSDTFSYRASNSGGQSNIASAQITVEAAVPPPNCTGTSATTPAGAAVQVTLRCTGEGSLTFSLTAQPQHGVLSDFDPVAGVVTYTPNAGFSGSDTFSYRASNAGGQSGAASALINVHPVSPPPPDGQPGGSRFNLKAAIERCKKKFRHKPPKRRKCIKAAKRKAATAS